MVIGGGLVEVIRHDSPIKITKIHLPVGSKRTDTKQRNVGQKETTNHHHLDEEEKSK